MNNLIQNLGRGGLQTLLLAAAGGVVYITKSWGAGLLAYSVADGLVRNHLEGAGAWSSVQRGGVGVAAGGGLMFTPIG